MTRDEESQNFFFRSEPQVLIPIGNIGKFVVVLAHLFLLEHAKQAMLPGFGVALDSLCTLNSFVEDCHKLRASA